MSMEMQMQKLALELRNLSTYQLETFKEVTEVAAMHVHESNSFWKNLIEQCKNSWDSLDTLSRMKVKNSPSWVKLTDYLYMEGVAVGRKKVLVDIGGDYYVYMALGDAKDFFERKGAYSMEMLAFYEDLFYKKRLVYYALDEALNRKLKMKLEKIDQMREKSLEK